MLEEEEEPDQEVYSEERLGELLYEGIASNNQSLVEKAVERGIRINKICVNKYNRNGDAAIFLAAKMGNVEIVNYLLENGSNVNELDLPDKTPLTFAIQNNHLDVVKLLIAKGAEVNLPHSVFLERADTPLTCAVRLNRMPIVSYLIKKNANVNQIGSDGKTPLSWAVTTKNFLAVRILVSNGAVINLRNQNGTTALSLAEQLKNKNIFNYLQTHSTCKAAPTPVTTNKRKYRAQPNITETENSDEAMMTESVMKNPTLEEIKNLLTNEGTGVNQVDSNGLTLLANAIICSDIPIVEYLLTAGANVCKVGPTGESPLLLAVRNRNLEIIKLLLDNGALRTIQTAFIEAIALTDLEIIKFLKERGALINVQYNTGHTPLTKAIETNNLEIVKFLVEEGADVDMLDKENNHPLSIAFKVANPNIVKFLIDKGAELPKVIVENCPFLSKSIERNNFEMVEFLVNLGVKLDVVLECGFTPLGKAVQMENLKMVQYFIETGVNVNLVDYSGRYPLAIAATNRDIRAVELLISAEADIELAKNEIDELARVSDDFSIYIKMKKE